MNDTDMAYLAGVVDGEGCLRLLPRPGGTYGVLVRITQKAPELLHHLRSRFGGALRSPYGRSPCCVLEWTHRAQVRELLTLLVPHLTLKKRQARLLIRACDRTGRDPYLARADRLLRRMKHRRHPTR